MPKHGFQLAEDYDKKKHPLNAIAEIKYDGMMVLVENARLYNRRGRDVTFQFPEIHVDPKVTLVGELVILKQGISQFHWLQKRNVDNPKEIRLRSMVYPATLAAFDVLEVDGHDLTKEPLSKRREVLNNLEASGLLNGSCHVAEYMACPPEKVSELLDLMRAQNAEGIVVKDLDAQYEPRRSRNWQKVKAWKDGDYDVQSFELTPKGGFVVWIENKGYKQKVVVNDMKLAGQIQRSEVKRLKIRYLDEETSGALRQPHVHGVPWD